MNELISELLNKLLIKQTMKLKNKNLQKLLSIKSRTPFCNACPNKIPSRVGFLYSILG